MKKTKDAFETRVLRDENSLRVLRDDGRLTFSVAVGGYSCNQQLSVLEYDTRERIELRMAEIGAQVCEEVARNGASRRSGPLPADIQALVDQSPL